MVKLLIAVLLLGGSVLLLAQDNTHAVRMLLSDWGGLTRYGSVNSELPDAEPHGSLVATGNGTASAYALLNIQERGELFIGPGAPVYAGMVVGEAAKDRDVDVNACKLKKLSNVRSKGEETTDALTPPRELTLELALEYIGENELLEG